jgi:hypothetical protein
MGSPCTFPRRLFWRRWQPKLSKLSQNFFCDLARELSDTPRRTQHERRFVETSVNRVFKYSDSSEIPPRDDICTGKRELNWISVLDYKIKLRKYNISSTRVNRTVSLCYRKVDFVRSAINFLKWPPSSRAPRQIFIDVCFLFVVSYIKANIKEIYILKERVCFSLKETKIQISRPLNSSSKFYHQILSLVSFLALTSSKSLDLL